MSRIAGAWRLLFPIYRFHPNLRTRLTLAIINYSTVSSWWRPTFIKPIISKKAFCLTASYNGEAYKIFVSGHDYSHVWVCNEIFGDGVYDLELVPFNPTIVVDLGANLGLFSLIAAKRWPESLNVCVEPSPGTFSLLCKNLEVNGVKATLLNCAAGRPRSLVEISDSLAISNYTAEIDDCSSNARLTMGLEVMIPDNADSVLIKIDIEGAEYQLLESFNESLPEKCFIFIELHDGEKSVVFIERWAKANGFSFKETRRRGDAIDGYLVRSTPRLH